MSAFSSLNSNSSNLYMLPLSNLSLSSTNSLSTILNNKDKSVGISPSINSIYSCSGDEYRQCRRIRNTAIANQQKQNPNQYLAHQDSSTSISQPKTNRSSRRLSRFWNTVRLFQLGLRHRNQTGQYVQQINNPDFTERRTTTATSLHTIEEDESTLFHRADIEIAEPVYNELPVTMPVVPQPTFITLSNNDQDDEQDTTPVTGQTLCKIFPNLSFIQMFIFFFCKYISQQNYLVMKMLFVFLLVIILV